MMKRRFAVLAVLISLGACTPMRWEHPQYGAAGTETDLTDCSRSARTEAWRQSFMYSAWDYPSYYRGRDGRLYRDPFPMRHRGSTFDEWQLRDYCMWNKGYRLVPIPEPTGS
jgi:hypothetical protein